MGKRLTISDYLFAFLFIFMIFCIIVAFFYGVHIGKSKAATQYEQQLLGQMEDVLPDIQTAYQQQHLVSFYYNVYYPFRTFQSSWTNSLGDLLGAEPADTRAAIKRLSNSAEEVYRSIEVMTLPDHSPLLQHAQTNYLRSLRLLQEADVRADTYDGTSKDIIQELLQDPYIADALQYATTAQDQFYEAIVYWHESVVVELDGLEHLTSTDLSLAVWVQLPFNVQNSIVAKTMRDYAIFANYTPQDVTANIIAMIDAGKDQALGLRTIQEAVTLLRDTNAVRSGDFFSYRDAFFADEILPQLPFYDES